MATRSSVDKLNNLSLSKRDRLIASLVDKWKKNKPLPAPRRQTAAAVAASFEQERLWFLDQLEPGNPAYLLPNLVRLHGRLNLPGLAQGLNELLRRHESLRTSFRAQGATVLQEIAAPAPLPLPVVDLSGLRPAEREPVARRLMGEQARRVFDLTRSPLLRAVVLRSSELEHFLLLTVHHIVADAWSMALIIEEVGKLYPAYGQGQPSPLADLPIQFADYALQQRDRLGEAGALAAKLAYWKGLLSGAPTVLELAGDRARPALPRYQGATRRFEIAEPVAEAIRKIGLEQRATPFISLLTAFGVLLYKYSGQPSLVIGSPVANRQSPALEQVIGFFVNTLALRLDIGGGATYGGLIGRTREMMLEAGDHQDLPLGTLLEHLEVQREANRSPLFQVMFGVQNIATPELELGGLRLELVDIDAGAAKFDMTLMIHDTGKRLAASLEYDTDLFEGSTIERLELHFQVILAELSRDGGRRIGELSVLSESQRQQVLVEWNDTRRGYGQEGCIQDVIGYEAGRRPDQVGLVQGEAHVTYEVLEERSNQLANYLIGQGIKEEELIGVSLERGVGMVVGLLGVLKAGGAYVPLDPGYPSKRLAYMLEDASPAVVISAGEAADKLPAYGGQILRLDSEWAAISRHSKAASGREVRAANAAYVLYTSGSTGEPKGVIGLHGGIMNRLKWMWESYGFGEREVCCAKTSLNFVDSVWEIFGALGRGVRLILIGEEEVKEVDRLVRVLGEEQVTRVVLVPSLLQALLGSEEEMEEGLRSLRIWVSSGEALRKEVVERFKERLPGRELLNLYGSSEVAGDVTAQRAGEEGNERSVGIGRPIANTEVYGLDRDQEAAPIGALSELYVGGSNLARGYHKRAELTAERFVPNGYKGEGERLFRTGDVVRQRATGELEYVGRGDQQVKIRGYRIELGEIEAALNEHEQVAESVAVVRESEGGEKQVVAYVVWKREGEVGGEELRRYLRGSLPGHMMPGWIVKLEEMPLLPNGKIDRGALAKAEYKVEGVRRSGPRNAVEELISGIWTDVLGVEEIGIEDNFFDLGGHSLRATQVAARVRSVLGLDIPLRTLIMNPTVASMATVVTTAAEGVAGAELPALEPVHCTPLPLSFSQERLWFINQLGLEKAAYNIPGALRLSGELDIETLRQSLSEIVRRHDVLRTSFPVGDDSLPVQEISAFKAMNLRLVDLNWLDYAEREDCVDRLAQAEAGREFDLESGPLIRATLLRLDTREHVLLVTLHHIVSDGWSVGIMLREFMEIYRAFRESQPRRLPNLRIQYADYAVWQRQCLQGEVLQQQRNYWTQALKDLTVLELPTDHPRSAVPSNVGASERTVLSAELTHKLKELSRREGLTLFMTLLGVFQLLLARYSGQEDIAVGAPIAGRDLEETEVLLGFFVNTLVMRTNLEGNPTGRELLHRVRETALGAYAHRGYPFEKLVEELHPDRTLSRSPLFEVFINMLNVPDIETTLGGLTVQTIQSRELDAKFDLTLYIKEVDGTLQFNLVYRSALFERDRILSMLDQYSDLLKQFANSLDEKIGSYSLVSRRDAQVVPNPYVALDLPWHGGVIEQFQNAAARHPEQLAVVDKHGSWTYGELDVLSNQLAQYLIGNGIQPGDVVAIYASRNASLVLALLGVLKSAASFLILDPAYPQLRLVDYLTAARPSGLLHIQEAGPVPAEIEDFLATAGLRCRLTLPACSRIDSLEALGRCSRLAPVSNIGFDDIAYIGFTSGSMGTPKGILGRYGPLELFGNWASKEFGLGHFDKVSMLSGLSHDPLHRDILSTLQLGGTICVPGSDEMTTPGRLARWMRRQGVTTTHLTPAMSQLLCEGIKGDEGFAIDSLRHAFFIGEVLTRRDVTRLREIAPSLSCINLYGTTETQRAFACHVVPEHEFELPRIGSGTEGERAEKEMFPLGRGIEGVQLLVLNEAKQLCGVGEVGEICFRSPYLAKGYLDDAESTAQQFIVNPFTKNNDDRVYRTGDLGRYRPDGEVEFAGRDNQQVKIRGFRVELAEIEGALRRFPGIVESVVLTREAAAGGKQLIAYLVPDRVGASEPEAMRAFLSERLPNYMIPSLFVELAELPLTPNGKLDRRALLARAVDDICAENDGNRTPVEELLAGIWSEVLRVDDVGTDQNFFELGGHSLLATQVISRVRDVFDIEVPLRVMFEQPTVRGLAEVVQQQVGSKIEAPPIKRVSRGVELPLSFAQQRLWFIQQLEPESALYNMPTALRLSGGLNVGALEQSLSEVVRRHEGLRTSFPLVDGEPYQMIGAAKPVVVQFIDLSEINEEERTPQAQRLAKEEAEQAFELSRGPLLRVKVVRLAEQEHLLLVTLHHIVSDGWSTGILVREFSTLYDAYQRGERSSLTELDIHYADFALWQRNYLRREVLQNQLDYWRGQLGNATTVLELRTDRPRPAVPTFNGARERAVISQELSLKLKALSQGEGATLFMVMLAAFKVLLYRYSGQEEFILGSVVANRNKKEIEGLIGFFVNTLMLKADLSKDVSYRQFLRQVREVALGAYANQDVPFEKLVEELHPVRNIGRNPIFQVMFTLQNSPAERLALPGLSLVAVESELVQSRFELTLDVIEAAGGLTMIAGYNKDLFNRDTIERLLAHYEKLLQEVVTWPDRNISQLQLLTESEWRQIVEEWNDTDKDYPLGVGVIKLFEAQVEQTPEEVAAVFGQERLTYRQINNLANQYARTLLSRGIGKGGYAAILMDRSLEVLISVIAILKTGAAFVPLDINWPIERLKQILKELGGATVLVDEANADLLDEAEQILVRLDAYAESDKVANVPIQIEPDDLIYVIYTSGSTGRPKGAMVCHRGITNRLLWMNEYFGAEASRVAIQTTNHVYDSAVWQMLWPLINGGKCVIPASETVATAGALSLLIEQHQVTIADFVPSVFNEIVPELVANSRTKEKLKTLKSVIIGGEEITPSTTHKFMAEFPEVQVMNLYGPTEASIGCIYYEVTGREGLKIPIGRPIANVKIHILDEGMNPVPVGVAGELYIAGVGVGLGYLNDENKTREAFLKNPFAKSGNERVYKTGDLAYYTPDGNIQFIGRADNQIKIRGFRIEPGEIEFTLRQYAAVREVVVIAREDRAGDKRLVAYVVAAGDTTASASQMRDYLKERLPEYMVPTAYVMLDEMPLTPNGKLDRKALPAPDYASPESLQQMPRTPVEEIIAGIYGSVLRVSEVSATGDFFEMGGHSLLATQVISRVREAFGVELALRAIFEEPTVAGLAEQVEAARAAGKVERAPAIEAVSRDERLALSYAQQRLWFIQQLEPASSAYNIPMTVRLVGELNVAALEQSLGEITRRHEVLRTRFAVKEEQPIQVIEAAAELRLRVWDVSHLAEVSREQMARQVVQQESRRGFDLQTGPVMRVGLVRLSQDEHVLVVVLHHIASDGWSTGVLVKEFSHLYEVYSTGQPSALAELEMQYADYAVWQREWLQGELLDQQLHYWRGQLADLGVLELPTDRPRPAVASHRGASVGLRLSDELSEQLKQLSQQQGVTMFMLLMAAFQLLLSRYSGQQDIAVGTPIAGRNRLETEGLIGFFVNTLVLRADLSGNPTVSELLGRVRETALQAYAHQAVPFEKLVEDLQPQRSLSHAPLFQVMVIFQNAPQTAGRLPDVAMRPFPMPTSAAKFDLTLTMAETSGELLGTLEYATELYDRSRMERLAGHFLRVLEQMAGDVGRAVAEIELLSEAERQQVIEWNSTAVAYAAEPSVAAMIEAQVAARPEAVALVFEDEHLSYADLNARANQLAHYLCDQGLRPEGVVALYFDRGLDLVIAVLAVLKTSGVYLPLDPVYPAARIAFMLEDAQAAFLLTQESLIEELPESACRVIGVERERQPISCRSRENPSQWAEPQRLAYLIYTSGSTGRPKGVGVAHRGLTNLICSMSERLGFQETERWLGVTSLSFDIAMLELFVPLTSGGVVVVASQAEVVDGRRLKARLAECEATYMQATPAGWRQLLESGWEGEGACRYALCGGEAIPAGLSEALKERVAKACNLYGPTETTIWSTMSWLGEGEREETIGRPLENTEIQIMDERMRGVPIGVAGELYIGGVGLARGYVNRAEATAERFLPDPYGEEEGRRIYRTGDVARYRWDGEIEYLGRMDNQVKVRGYRIELGEIEAVVGKQEGVQQCAVVVREEEGRGKQLVCYYVARAGGEVSSRELKEQIAKRLPEYMVPGVWVMLEEMPLTANGKLDRKALPAPVWQASDAQKEAAATPVEELISGIWSAVLGVGEVGVEDNFFELGGHSLLATQVISRLREVFDIEVPLRVLFESPTVAGLARAVDGERGTDRSIKAQAIHRIDREQELPLSFAQQRLWFIHQLEPDSPAYNIQVVLRLEGVLDISALRQSLHAIESRHEALRTRFPVQDGRPSQVIDASRVMPFAYWDLSGLDNGEREMEAAELGRQELLRPFDLERGPVWRVALERLAPQEHMLFLCIHHIVGDGWSIGVMVREFTELYAAFREGRPSPLPELSIQYADFAVWQREWFQKEEMERQMAYWRERLREVPTLSLPSDHPRPSTGLFRGGARALEFDQETSEGLKRLSLRENATLFMVMLAAFKVLLMRYANQEDIAVGIPIANRNRNEIERLIGFFVNSLVIRTDLGGRPSFRELIKRVRAGALEAYAHQDLPFERLVEELQPERDMSRNPLFQISFAMQNAPRTNLEMGDVVLTPQPVKEAPTRFDMEVQLWERSGRISGRLIYSADLYDPQTIERLAGNWAVLLEAVIAAPDENIWTLPYLTQTERRQLLEWNETDRDYAPEQTITELVERQAEIRPETVAVVFNDEYLTFEGLERKSNRLAHYLREIGAGPEVVVGLYIERSLEMVVGIMGVLKSGGAYLPIDPAAPKQRVAFMLAEAEVGIILTLSGAEKNLPPFGGRVITLDGLSASIESCSSERPEKRVNPDNLAYVIYTSGSTGTPKGVMVTHRGLVNYLKWSSETYRAVDGSGAPVHSELGFDLTVTGLYGPLVCGKPVVLVKEETGVEGLLRLVRKDADYSLVKLTPAHLELLAADERGVEEVAGWSRGLVIGGEALEWERLKYWQEHAPETRLINEYGPTETVVGCSVYEVMKGEKGDRSVPIGKPIANTRIYVVGREGEIAPVGVDGEIWVAGEGVSRGYLKRADLTAERFIPNPFGKQDSARLYRTGDLGRYRADGNLEFLGRIDDQIKVRGYRIELGEIESVLRQHEDVQDCVVTATTANGNDKKLIAYVVPGETGLEEIAEEWREERVTNWQSLYDSTYREAGNEEEWFNLTGWDSSYTGEAIPREEMEEWVNNTVKRIKRLKPRRVLEIGCGTGLLISKIAPDCEQYVGTDFSEVVLNYVRRQVRKEQQRYGNVLLMKRAADDLHGIAEGEFDLVILNSVSQYFPDARYLMRVVRGAAKAVRRGGHIFIGDVRSLPLLEAFHASIEMFKAGDELRAESLKKKVRQGVGAEAELVIDPRFFVAAKRECEAITHIEVKPKRGKYANELTRYRYDVVLHVGSELSEAKDITWVEWDEIEQTEAGIKSILRESGEGLVVLRGVRNGRVEEEVEVAKQMEEASDATLEIMRGRVNRRGIDPEVMMTIVEDAGYVGELSWISAKRDGSYDVIVRSRGKEEKGVIKDWEDDQGEDWRRLTNRPLRAKLGNHVIPGLRRHLGERLPEYMVPSQYLLIERIPLTTNGKVDRGALPDFEDNRPGQSEDLVAPRTIVEQLLCGIWSQVLGLDRIGIEDNFFDLGGHSLLATQVVSRVRSVLGLDISVRSLFNNPTIAGLAVEATGGHDQEQRKDWPEMRPVGRARLLPLSFSQERLWFIDQLGLGRAAYNLPAAMRLSGSLNLEALRQGLSELVRRHEVLRTSFPVMDALPVQEISEFGQLNIDLIDLSILDERAQNHWVEKLAQEEQEIAFDLAKAPLIRAKLLRLRDREHVLLVTMHHIVSDGWSMGVMVREFTGLYEAFQTGEPSSLPELRIQYADFAVWQREWMRGELLQSQLDYWKRQLSDVPVLELPTDRPRPAVASYGGATEAFNLSPGLMDKLKHLARRESVTLFMILQAGLQLLFARYTGKEDIAIGFPIAGRNKTEVEGLIGCFFNTLVMRIDFSGNPPVRDVLGRVRETALEAYANQDLPFDKLVEDLHPVRSLSHQPLFQAMLLYENTPQENLTISDLNISGISIRRDLAKYDLTLSVLEKDGQVKGILEYATDLFDRSTIVRMRSHLLRLLEGMADDLECRGLDLPMLRNEDWEEVIWKWNRTAAEYPTDLRVHHLFEKQARENPDAIVLIFEEQQITYEALNGRANQLAHYLRKCGVGPETRVGLCVNRGFDLMVGILGTLKAGAAYVPLDPTYPRQRLSLICEDARPPVLVTQQNLLDSISGLIATTVCLDSDWDKIGAEEIGNPIDSTHPLNLAYVIYTSGSTGKPKGVQITHTGLVNLLHSMREQPGLSRQDVALALTTVSFDMSKPEIFLPLIVGGTIVMADREAALDGYKLIHILERHRVNFMQGTPQTWRLLLEAGWRGADHLKIICGGEAITTELAEQLLHKGGELWNLYGPTETTVWSSARRVEDGFELTSIGGVINNTQLYLLAENLQPAAIGVYGELYIGGDGVARGYNNNPSLTAEKFIPDPFSNEPGARLYRTGDLGRLKQTGVIELIGRRDNQVKVSGFRIELGAIEAVLTEHPAVREAVVIARQDAAGEKRLVAYLLLMPAFERPSASQMRLFLQGRLPDFMVPSAFIVLESYPMLPSGKIDRKSLPSPEAFANQALALDSVYVAPANKVEEKLAAVWQHILNIEKIGVHDNFFELGGNSILAIKITAALHKQGVEVKVSDLFQYPTIARIAPQANALQVDKHQGAVTGQVPLTPYQLWALAANGGRTRGRAFLLSAGLRLMPEALEAAAIQLSDHHDALRLKSSSDSLSLEHETSATTWPVLEFDLRESARAREEFDELTARLLTSLDLVTGPAMTLALVHLPEGDGLLISALDILIDDHSFTLLIADLTRLYSQHASHELPALPPKTESFKAWAEGCAGLADGGDLSRIEPHLQDLWHAGTPPLHEQSDGKRPTSEVEGVLEEEQTGLLLGKANEAFNTEAAELILAGLAIGLAPIFGGDQTLIVIDEDARRYLLPQLEVSRTVGCFRNLYPVYLEPTSSNDVFPIIVRVKEGVRRARQVAPNGVLSLLERSKSAGGASPPLVEFRFENWRLVEPDGWSVLELDTDSAVSDVQAELTTRLKVTASVRDNQLRLTIRYSGEHHQQPLMERLIAECMDAIGKIVEQCKSKERPELTPSDFTYKELSIDAIDNLFD